MGSMYNSGERVQRLHKLKQPSSDLSLPSVSQGSSQAASPQPSNAALRQNFLRRSIPSIFESLSLPVFGLGRDVMGGVGSKVERLLEEQSRLSRHGWDPSLISVVNLPEPKAKGELPRQIPGTEDVSHLTLAPHKDAILQALREWPAVVIPAPTSSGKTTWLPRAILKEAQTLFPEGSLPEGVEPTVYCLVPRRIQTVQIAQYVAKLMDSPLGELVGYHNGKTGRSTPGVTRLIYATHGFFAEQARHNHIPPGAIVLLDETHEKLRSLSPTCLILRDKIDRGEAIKVGCMSATIDSQLFSDYFGGVPVIDPIQITQGGATLPEPGSLQERILRAANRGRKGEIVAITPLETVEEDIIAAVNRGETPIVFVAGKKDIESITERVGQLDSSIICRPFHAQLPQRDQLRIFERAEGERSAVIATNVGGTGLTYPEHINTVIITPEVKRMRHIDGVNWLRREKITLSEIIQLLGRIARLREQGTAVLRLPKSTNPERPLKLEEHMPAEIQNTSLAGHMLKDLAVGRDIFVDNRRYIIQASNQQLMEDHALLYKLDLVGPRGRITELGRAAARFPVEPQMGKLLALADSMRRSRPGVIRAAIDIVAILDAEGIVTRDRSWQNLRSTNANCDLLAQMETFQKAIELGLHRNPEELSEHGIEEAAFFMALDTRNSLRDDLHIRIDEPHTALNPVETRAVRECVWSSLVPWLYRQVDDRDNRFHGERVYKPLGGGPLRLLSKGSVVHNAPFIAAIPLNIGVDEVSGKMSEVLAALSAPPMTLPLLLSASSVDREWLEHNIPPQCREAREAVKRFGRGRDGKHR